MPAPTHLIVIAPLDKVDAVGLKWGFTFSTNLYTEADPPVRTATHQVRSGPANTSQIALVSAHITSPDPDLGGVIAALWVRDQPSPYQQMLVDSGLTTDPGSI